MPFIIRIRAFVASLVLSLACSFAAQATPGQPGTLDATWATSSPLGAGKVITPIGNGADVPAAMFVQSDGKVLIGGTCAGTTSNSIFCVLRYDASGVLDASFGSGGKVVTQIGNLNNYVTAMAQQTDGKVLLVGYCESASAYYDFCAVRYSSNGTLDTTFNGNGKVVTPLGALPRVDVAHDNANSVALQPVGKMLLAGSCTFSAAQTLFCAARYNGDGSLDASFGNGGKVFTSVGAIGRDTAVAMTLQPDGNILLAGVCARASASDAFCALRYDAFGVVDESFGSGGKVVSAIGSGPNVASSVVLQPDGKIVMSGYCSSNGTSPNFIDFCALRYNSNGSLDASFGSSGTVVTAVSSGTVANFAFPIALQPDGKLLIAGTCSNGSINVFCVVRYHGNGVFDTSFGVGGKVLTAVGAIENIATAMALQPDGKMLLAGYCTGGFNYDFCAVRYDGGPFGYQNCKLDMDGDGRVLATTDMLIGTRIALGMTGSAVVSGITFPATATRTTWPLIRDYLVTQCGLSLLQ